MDHTSKHRRPHSPNILIIDHEEAAVSAIVETLQRTCCQSGQWTAASQVAKRSCGHCSCLQADLASVPCCVAIASLKQLHEHDLDQVDVVISCVTLPDGSGLDVLAYLRGIRPHLPVILLGERADTPLAVECIRAGAVDFIVNFSSDTVALPLAIEKSMAHQRVKHENERLHRDLSRSLAELADTNKQMQMLISQLQSMTRTDELTGLSNRRWLNEMLDRTWDEATRHDRPLAFLMIDLDGFKSLNDTMGHQRGDEILQLAAKVIRANCRQVDMPARYGGDEFCVLMPQTIAYEAERVAERIIREFEHAIGQISDSAARIGMSVGVSHVDLSRPTNAQQLISHADEALYAAKAAGKQRVMIREVQGVVEPLLLRSIT